MRVTRPTHAAHVFACLRIDGDLTVPAARLATGLLGSALAGRDSHPLDDIQDFSDSATCLLPDQPCLVAPNCSLSGTVWVSRKERRRPIPNPKTRQQVRIGRVLKQYGVMVALWLLKTKDIGSSKERG